VGLGSLGDLLVDLLGRDAAELGDLADPAVEEDRVALGQADDRADVATAAGLGQELAGDLAQEIDLLGGLAGLEIGGRDRVDGGRNGSAPLLYGLPFGGRFVVVDCYISIPSPGCQPLVDYSFNFFRIRHWRVCNLVQVLQYRDPLGRIASYGPCPLGHSLFAALSTGKPELARSVFSLAVTGRTWSGLQHQVLSQLK
jgi:hypothetical protein